MEKRKKQIDELIFERTQKRSKIAGDKSALTSITQYATRLRISPEIDMALRILYAKGRGNAEWDAINKAVLELQLLWGLRISEVISIKPSQVTSLGQIMIRGSKKSEDRIVMGYMYSNVWTSYVKKGNIIGEERDRYYYYNLYKKFGLYRKNKGKDNNSVTHIFRYSFVELLLKNNIEINEIQKLIGHKSVKSTEHYARYK
jgi:site-specific recombinase XerD